MELLARLVPSLVVIVGALFALRWWGRRMAAQGGQAVRVASRTGLSRGALLAVVEVDGRRLLVGVTDHAVNLVTELDRDAPTESALQAELNDAMGLGSTPGSLGGSNAVRDLAHARPAYPDDRPRMGLVDRLREMTVRTTPPRPPRGNPR